MSDKLKLGTAVAIATLVLPALAAAQDPTTRLDITVIGAVLTEDAEQAADTNAAAASELPVVYEDEAQGETSAGTANASTAGAASDLNHGVESE